MYGKSASENFHTQNITSELAKRIYDVIDEVEKVPEVSETYTGVLMGLSFVSYDFEFQEQKSKKIIHVAFSEDLENEVISRLRKSVTAKFKISTVFSDITYEEKKEWRLERFEE